MTGDNYPHLTIGINHDAPVSDLRGDLCGCEQLIGLGRELARSFHSKGHVLHNAAAQPVTGVDETTNGRLSFAVASSLRPVRPTCSDCRFRDLCTRR